MKIGDAFWIFAKGRRLAPNSFAMARRLFPLDDCASVMTAKLEIAAHTDDMLYANGQLVGRGSGSSGLGVLPLDVNKASHISGVV